LLYLFRVPVIPQLDIVIDEWVVRAHYSYSALAYLLRPQSAARLVSRFDANMHRIIPSDEFLPAMFIPGGHPRPIVQQAYGTGDGLLRGGGGAYSVASYLVTDAEVLASNSSIDCCASDVVSALYVVNGAVASSDGAVASSDGKPNASRKQWEEEVRSHPRLDELVSFVGFDGGSDGRGFRHAHAAVWETAAAGLTTGSEDGHAGGEDTANGIAADAVVMVVEARAVLGRWIDKDLSTVLDALPPGWDVLLLGATSGDGAVVVNDYITEAFSTETFSASTPSAAHSATASFAYALSASGLRLLASSRVNSATVGGEGGLIPLLRRLHQDGLAKVYTVSPTHAHGLVHLR
jgi:hypothetical protein